MLHNIPGDTGGVWRWNKLIEMCKYEDIIHDDPSPTMVLALWADYHRLNNSQKTWLSVLYGLTYSTTSAIFVFRNFSTLKSIEEDTLAEFWKKYKDLMYFNRDRRYIKSNNQFVPSIMSIKKRYETSNYMWEHLRVRSDTEVYEEIVKYWKYFGRHAAFLFFDAYSKMLYSGKCTLSSIQNWNEASTIAEGLALAAYDDNMYLRCQSKCVTPKDSKKLDDWVNKLILIVDKPFNDIESAICAYTKVFKGTRYVGYYIDRFQEELEQCEILPKDIDLLYKLRIKVTPKEYLGECSGWHGIRKERNKLWLKEGKLL